MKKAALIIDDDRSERRIVSRILKTQFDLMPIEAENGQAGIEALHDHADIKIVIMDLDMPVMDGRTALPQISGSYPDIPVIILTGTKRMKDAVLVMKNGAFDFLSKPIEEDRLTLVVRNALKLALMSREISRLKRKDRGGLTFSDLIGHDSGLLRTIMVGKKAAATQSLPVLINGETGTGKEMFAQAIHADSARNASPFVAVNCGALPEKLIESTLFGHEKGAFTGAIDKALGKFREAHGGTLFLDEIGELPQEAQVKLLRALQQKEVEPVGASKAVKVDVRIISATHRDLKTDVKSGRFREDLYFRLNVLCITMPPLRDRQQDIEDLATYFIDLFCANHQAAPKALSDDALKKLRTHHWPGNVRELENVINRAMVLCDTAMIDESDVFFSEENERPSEDHLPQYSINTVQDDGTFKTLKSLEQEIVSKALDFNKQNVSKTARTLDIAKSTLYTKMASREENKAS